MVPADDRGEAGGGGAVGDHGELADEQVRAALEAMIDDVAIGVPERDADGRIVDFVMIYASNSSVDGAGRPTASMVGKRVTELYPRWRESGMMERFTRVVETGEPYIDDRREYTDFAPDGSVYSGYWSVSVARFGEGYVAASRDVTSLVRAEEARRAAAAEADRLRWAAELVARVALPEVLPCPSGFEIGARYVPAATVQSVGGDWYDAFELGDGCVGLVIGDVAGHGADAAASMVQARNVVRGLAVHLRDPGLVLAAASAVIAQLGAEGRHATCCYGVLDPERRTFRWASAGHLDPLLVGGDARYLATAGGPPLGVDPTIAHPVSTVELTGEDRLVLYTDGLVERREESIEIGLDRLRSEAARLRSLAATELADALVDSVDGRTDDLAVLCVRALP